MMYNYRYLPENFEQWRPENPILRHNLNVRSGGFVLFQDRGKKP